MSEEFGHPWFSMVVEYKNCLDHLKIGNKGMKEDNYLLPPSIMNVQDGRHCISHNPLVGIGLLLRVSGTKVTSHNLTSSFLHPLCM